MSTLFSHFFTKFNQIAPLEADFTEVLDAIAVKPKMLYFYGKMPENVLKGGKKRRPKAVAVVGSRRNTKYGEEVAYKIARELAARGVVVISGLAYGIDSIAHKGAIEGGGKTVAVLGTPIDKIYPEKHLGLAEEIVRTGGAIMSEYAPGADLNYRRSFLERNRLIAGLADAVVVVEAADHSGTLNTAAHALSEGREVFAVPGNITNVNSVGCNRLISQGATPFISVEDLLERVYPGESFEGFGVSSRGGGGINKRGRIIKGANEEENAILRLISVGVTNGEEMMARLKMPAAVFNRTVTFLEIKGIIRALGANCWGMR